MTLDASRRSFLTGAAALAGTAFFRDGLFSRTAFSASTSQDDPRFPICIFVKFLQTLSFDELAQTISEMGVAGIEATVRANGQVLPEQVETELPKLVEALRQRNLEVTIMTSNVNRVDQPLTEKVLRTAVGLGIKRYRMDYYRYDLNKPLAPQMKELKSVIADLAALNRELGIQGVYQNHAGANYVGAGIWDMVQLLENIPPSEIAIAYDTRHAAVEGGTTWPTTWNLVQPHLGSVFVKNTRWKGRQLDDGALGMPDGIVDSRFFSMLKKSQFSGPISLHVEYLPKAPPAVQITEIQQNLATLRKLMADA